MNNTTLPQLESAASLDSPGFMAYAILMVVITLVPGVMCGFTLIALAMDKSTAQLLRLFLMNLLLAGLVTAVGAVFLLTTSAVLVVANSGHLRLPLYLCRVYLWTFTVGASARLLNLAAFSLSVLTVVRFGKKTISKCYVTAIIAILWSVPVALSLYILLPYVFEVQFVDGVACFPDSNNVISSQAAYIFFSLWVILGGFIPMTISITVPIICICYIKHTVTDQVQYWKGMAKFSLFLLLGNTINIVGQVIPGLLTWYYTAAPGVYLAYSFPAVSLFPTPIIIIAYLKPVQEQVKKLFTCSKVMKATKELKGTRNTSETGEGDKA